MIYRITTGTLSTDEGEVILEHCYSGGDHGIRPEAVNNPVFCEVHSVGPLPLGKYALGVLHLQPTLGPAMALMMADGNSFGRGGFFMHYNNPHRDAAVAPYPKPAGRNSSDGCICVTVPGYLDKVEALRATGDNKLTITA